jgi:hypothetical protein
MSLFIDMVRSIWKAITSYLEWRQSKRIKVMKQNLLRYFEQAQGMATGTVSYTIVELKIHGIISEEEVHVWLAEEALLELCNDGKVEYFDGRYYLKGRVPPMPFKPYGA